MNEMLLQSVLYVTVIMGLGVLMWFLPEFHRRDILFSVTVDPFFREGPEAKDIIGSYRRQVASETLLVSFLVVGLNFLGRNMPKQDALVACVYGLTPLLLIVLCLTSGSLARRKVKPFAVRPVQVFEASLAWHARRPLGPAMMAFLSGPMLIILGTAVYLWMNWDSIPESFPIHWDLKGNPNGWGKRTVGSVGGLLVISTFMYGFLICIPLLIGGQMRRHFASGRAAELEERAHRLMFVLMGLLTYLFTIFQCAISAWLPLFYRSHAVPGRLVVFTSILLISLSMVVVAMVAFRMASLKEEARKAAVEAAGNPHLAFGDRTEDRYWRWGVYFNPNDPAIWVEKRMGIGWTFNAAHWQAYVWLVAFIGLPALTILLITKYLH